MFSKIMQFLNKQKIGDAIDRMGLREYDLPLNKDQDSNFLILLVGLMSFLAILALTGTFALGGMTARWSSGLENKITVEIPVETREGHLLSQETLKKETIKLAAHLEGNANVKSVAVLSEEDMGELISPWLGKDFSLENLPLPSLISVELKISTPEAMTVLEEDISENSPYAIVQNHHDWLQDLIRFARTLKILALAIALIISGATITAIAAGIRTRMSIHKKEVELLHLMGATDDYISRQFQRHAMMIALKGSVYGTVAGVATTLFIIILSGHSGTSLIPQIQISLPVFMSLCIVPLIACVIAALASRFTVLRTLARMP